MEQENRTHRKQTIIKLNAFKYFNLNKKTAFT